jgi:WD40 repeat protein
MLGGHVFAYSSLFLLSLRSIAWNPLGSLVATGSSDKTLRVCELFLHVDVSLV